MGLEASDWAAIVGAVGSIAGGLGAALGALWARDAARESRQSTLAAERTARDAWAAHAWATSPDIAVLPGREEDALAISLSNRRPWAVDEISVVVIDSAGARRTGKIEHLAPKPSIGPTAQSIGSTQSVRMTPPLLLGDKKPQEVVAEVILTSWTAGNVAKWRAHYRPHRAEALEEAFPTRAPIYEFLVVHASPIDESVPGD